MRVPLLPDRPQGEAIQLCLFHQASAVLLIPAALLPVDDRDRDIFAMLKIITHKKKRPTIEDIYLTGSGTSLMPLPIFCICTFYYMCVNFFIYLRQIIYIYMLSDYLITGRKTP